MPLAFRQRPTFGRDARPAHPDCDTPDPSQRAVRPPQEGTPSGRYRPEGGAYAVPMIPHPSAPLRGLPKGGGYALRVLYNHYLCKLKYD